MISTNRAVMGTYSPPTPIHFMPPIRVPRPTANERVHTVGSLTMSTIPARPMPMRTPARIWTALQSDRISVGCMLSSAPSGA